MAWEVERLGGCMSAGGRQAYYFQQHLCSIMLIAVLILSTGFSLSMYAFSYFSLGCALNLESIFHIGDETHLIQSDPL